MVLTPCYVCYATNLDCRDPGSSSPPSRSSFCSYRLSFCTKYHITFLGSYYTSPRRDLPVPNAISHQTSLKSHF
ncbi:hypothetical protein EYC84_009677 [Monilinia fructicola]|uniref:Uncharacterized protein n=1 Tax=Monilinia fructicola TaxID=38448 RepID=A0A5M9J9E4_MONFR|nr:hypothetical protein EYC84_009677 [Monilinia fructicola]